MFAKPHTVFSLREKAQLFGHPLTLKVGTCVLLSDLITTLLFQKRFCLIFVLFCFSNHNQNVLEVFLVCVFVSCKYSFHPLLKTCLGQVTE